MQTDVDELGTLDSLERTPSQEARVVIETETRCHEAATLEPAFLIAMR